MFSPAAAVRSPPSIAKSPVKFTLPVAASIPNRVVPLVRRFNPKLSFVPKLAAAPSVLPFWTKAVPAPVKNPQFVLLFKQTVPLLSGSVIVRVPLVEAPVILKLFVPGVSDVPAMYSSWNGAVPDPRSMLVVPGNSDVLIATLLRLDNAVFAPPPPPPRQLPLLKQTVPSKSGNVYVRLAVSAPWTIVPLKFALP